MNKNWDYSNRSLAKIESLLKTLRTNEQRLDYIIKNKQNYFRQVPVTRKRKKRTTYKVVGELLKIHKLIKQHIFTKIILPDYITGGRKGVSYIDDCKMHCDKSIILKEDIKNFFPSITEELITKAFQYYFNFSPEVSSLLANISTLNGTLVQGTTLSADIANLIFLEEEIIINNEIRRMGGVYSRYVDDITIGFESVISNSDITKIKKMISSMAIKSGLRLNKDKYEILRDGQTKIVHGVKVIKDLRPTKKRKNETRMCLYNLKKKILAKENVMNILSLYFKIRGLINTLKQQGDANHANYTIQLNNDMSNIDRNDAIKTIRGMRKTKDVKKLRALYSKLKPLANISNGVAIILNIEYKSRKIKLQQIKS